MCPLYSRKFEIFERSVSALFWCPLYSKEYGNISKEKDNSLYHKRKYNNYSLNNNKYKRNYYKSKNNLN